jgi:hypothetical protein
MLRFLVPGRDQKQQYEFRDSGGHRFFKRDGDHYTLADVRSEARKAQKKFLASLFENKPIVPKHQSPKAIGDGFGSLIDDMDRRFFDDFRDFANVVNAWLAAEHVGSSWRLQELPETELRLVFVGEPVFGRRYAVYHNQVRLGTMEVAPSFRYSRENPESVQT